jgi:hypothetical protein
MIYQSILIQRFYLPPRLQEYLCRAYIRKVRLTLYLFVYDARKIQLPDFFCYPGRSFKLFMAGLVQDRSIYEGETEGME